MKPIYNSQKTIVKSLRAVVFLFLATLSISSLCTSCTTDEIEMEPKNKIIKETFSQRNDSIFNDTIPATNTTTTSGEIIPPPPPVKGNNPPPPPNP